MLPKLPPDIRTPAYVLDVAALKHNLKTAARIKHETGCRILLATKSWAMPAAFPLMRDTLDGTTASGEYEARMGREEFGKEVHVYAPAYASRRGRAVDRACRPHLSELSRAKWRSYLPFVKAATGVKLGVRINPGFSNATLGGALYDPCAARSRFGTTRDQIDQLPWDEIDILHAHALCESLRRRLGRADPARRARVRATTSGASKQ